MLFDYADAKPTQRVLIHGPAGNVGASVQLASQAGLQVFATASEDLADVRSLGAVAVVDYKTTRFENTVPPVDAVIDTVGGNTRARSLGIIKPGGVLVTSVSERLPEQHQANGGSRVFFLVEVTASRLDKIADLFDQSKLIARVGTVLPLEQGRIAHEMLAGAPHKRGKIVLEVGGLYRFGLICSPQRPALETPTRARRRSVAFKSLRISRLLIARLCEEANRFMR